MTNHTLPEATELITCEVPCCVCGAVYEQTLLALELAEQGCPIFTCRNCTRPEVTEKARTGINLRKPRCGKCGRLGPLRKPEDFEGYVCSDCQKLAFNPKMGTFPPDKDSEGARASRGVEIPTDWKTELSELDTEFKTGGPLKIHIGIYRDVLYGAASRRLDMVWEVLRLAACPDFTGHLRAQEIQALVGTLRGKSVREIEKDSGISKSHVDHLASEAVQKMRRRYHEATTGVRPLCADCAGLIFALLGEFDRS